MLIKIFYLKLFSQWIKSFEKQTSQVEVGWLSIQILWELYVLQCQTITKPIIMVRKEVLPSIQNQVYITILTIIDI